MTISYVSSTIVEANSISSMPSHQANDLLIFFGFRTNASGITLPTGINLVQLGATRLGNGLSTCLAAKRATSGSEVSGTWTNATGIVCMVFRSDTYHIGFGNVSSTGISASTTITYPTLLGKTSDGSAYSWYAAFAVCNSNSTDFETAPSGLTNRVSLAGTGAFEATAHDSNGLLSTWPSTARTNSIAVNYHNWLVDIYETSIALASAGALNPLTASYGKV